MAARALKFPSHLKELRIHLCQKSPASQGVRDFIEKSYVDLKKTNPSTPILIRECSGVNPRVWARFEMGKESSVSLDGLKVDQVSSSINTLVQQR
ncbi:UNVERIFIED_CONTAM: hypothetical protein RMT77_010430 [Armadillidium vulgare]|nr:NADH dehydrogenase [ubiquinone] 1 alpha subcomplex subunit 2 [Armadillidium vulgare]